MTQSDHLPTTRAPRAFRPNYQFLTRSVLPRKARNLVYSLPEAARQLKDVGVERVHINTTAAAIRQIGDISISTPWVSL